jgi:hypothetical protein
VMGIIMLKVGRTEGWVFWELWPSYFGGGPSGEELFLRWCLVGCLRRCSLSDCVWGLPIGRVWTIAERWNVCKDWVIYLLG